MTYVFLARFITRNSLSADKLGQSSSAEMTETAMPQRGGGDGGEDRCAATAGGWEERVEVTRAIAPGDHAPSL
jgi:hypothetical protein